MDATFQEPRIHRENRDVTARGSVSPPTPTWQPNHEVVARRAYQIWQRHGCPAGTAFQDWLAAETELRSRR